MLNRLRAEYEADVRRALAAAPAPPRTRIPAQAARQLANARRVQRALAEAPTPPRTRISPQNAYAHLVRRALAAAPAPPRTRVRPPLRVVPPPPLRLVPPSRRQGLLAAWRRKLRR